MIKIMFMIHDLGHGGAEKVLVNLVNNMDRSKFDITVISLFGGGVNEQFLKEDIKYRTVFSKMIPGNSKLMKLLTPRQLHSMCVNEEYDIEVAYLEGPAARIVSGCPNKDAKLVSWIHCEQTSISLAAKSFRTKSEFLECYRKFDKVICVSELVKESVLKVYSTAKNIEVLYNTNETEKILQLKEECVEENVFNQGEIRLCGVGKIMPIKGFDKLARIHTRLRKEGFPVHTYILGVGEEKEIIEKYIVENDMVDTFTFLGYKTNPYKYMSNCDIFVCSSESEGFSTATTEALIVGTAVVTTPVGGTTEMLGYNGEYGLVSEMSEESLYYKIKYLLERKERIEYYKKQSLIRAKSFSKEETVQAVETMLLSL